MKQFFLEIKWFFTRIKYMMPRIKKYGLRYYFDSEFRRVIKQRLYSKKTRRKYGSGFLTNRKWLKRKLVYKFGQICQDCKNDFPLEELTIDHKIRIRDGGNNEFKNLQLLCRNCHQLKDAPYVSEAINKPFSDLKSMF